VWLVDLEPDASLREGVALPSFADVGVLTAILQNARDEAEGLQYYIEQLEAILPVVTREVRPNV
jgi:hypothetical protein